MEIEGIALPPPVVDLAARCHGEGHSLVLVAVDRRVAGAIELHTTIRPEARAIVRGLRRRHIASMYIISGDHEAPTRRLAETLGIEHYFAETLPENKAALIERLRAGGQGHLLRRRRHQRFDRDEEVPRVGVAARRLHLGRRHRRGDPPRREPRTAGPALRYRRRVPGQHDDDHWPPSSSPATSVLAVSSWASSASPGPAS